MPADSFSARLRLRLQATGGNNNTWGSLLNTAVAQLVEDAICGMATIIVAASDVTLSTNNGATDQGRMAILQLTGTPGAARNVFVPQITKMFLVLNQTGSTMTVKTSAGGSPGTVSIATGINQLIFCDGTNVGAVGAVGIGQATDSAELGGVVAAKYARLDIENVFTAAQAVSFVNMTDAATVHCTTTAGNNFYVQLGGNRTLALDSPTDGQEIELWIQQDGTGGRTLTWPANVKFENGSTAVLSTTAGALDRFALKYNATVGGGTWIARSGLFSAGGAATITITAGQPDANLFKLLGSPGSSGTFNVTIAAGVTFIATSPATPALDLSGFPSGSTINLTNLGYILGRGGDGGGGSSMGTTGSSFVAWQDGQNGRPGGTALKAPGTGITFNLTNANGFIWGGGGGGGGGGAQKGTGSSESNGGGGGGAAGGGRGGRGGVAGSGDTTLYHGTDGNDGGTGVNGVLGTGGAGAANGGGQGGAGGAGGDWGGSGGGGTSFGSGDFFAIPGSGGAAGKAIDLNGGSVNFLSGSGAPNVKGAVL